MHKKVAAIETVSPDRAEGELAALYRRLAGTGEPSHIYQAHSLNPEALAAHATLYRTVMFGASPLERWQRELVATIVSHENGCHY